jgi:hypothetical protein
VLSITSEAPKSMHVSLGTLCRKVTFSYSHRLASFSHKTCPAWISTMDKKHHYFSATISIGKENID